VEDPKLEDAERLKCGVIVGIEGFLGENLQKDLVVQGFVELGPVRRCFVRDLLHLRRTDLLVLKKRIHL